MAFKKEGLDSFIEQALKRYGQGENPLWKRIEKRRKHFYLLAPPVLPEDFARSQPEQWRGIKDAYVEVMSRLNENPWVARIAPIPDNADGRKRADEAEAVLNDGVRLFERKTGVNLQRGLTDAMFKDAYGVLKTTLAKENYPPLPESEIYDELPEAKDSKRYKAKYRYSDDGRRKRYYEETVDALRERGRNAKARGGWPWYHEVVDAQTVAFGEDRGIAEGPAWAVEVRQVGLIDYNDELRKADGVVVALSEENSKLRIYEETNAPASWMPSQGGYEHVVAICEVWTRDEFYELVTDYYVSGDIPYSIAWEVVKAAKTPYKRVPYFKAIAIETGSSDPALRYLPIADRLYDAKPALDRVLELQDVLAERTSLNEVYFVNEAGALLRRDDESGDPVILSGNSLGSFQIPAGYKPVSVTREVNAGFVQMVQEKLRQAEESKPSTGRAEGTTGTTPPWTVNQLQAQENIEPSWYLDNLAACFRECFGMMIEVMSDEAEFPDGVWTYASGKYASTKKGTLIGISSGEPRSLDVDVDISPTTASQRITTTELQRTLLNDPKWPITPLEALEKSGEDDPNKKLAEWYGYKAFEEQFLPAFINQTLVALFGNMVLAGVNGQPVGPGGVPVPPEQVIQAGQARNPQPNTPGGPIGTGQSPPGWLAREPLIRAMRPTALMPGSGAPPSGWGT